MHVIDIARIAHETCRGFFLASSDREVTATWNDLPPDRRQTRVDNAQAIIDGTISVSNEVEHLTASVVAALRPFLDE